MECLYCKSETKNPKFCSKSCATTFNNLRGDLNRRKPENNCKICKIAISTTRTYCSSCWKGSKTIHSVKINEWLAGTWSGGSDTDLSKIVRNYLLEKHNFSCSRCGFNTPHPTDNKTILEINHINGNGTDHRPENLEVLCPNCHALTDTYRGRNAGNGRPVFYSRVSRLMV